MPKSGLMQLQVVVSIALIATCLRICSAQEDSSSLFVSLVSNDKVYQTADKMIFSGFVHNRLPTDLQLVSSVLKVEDSMGNVVFSQDHAFGILESGLHNLKGSIGSYSSTNAPPLLKTRDQVRRTGSG
jgi:hypothetical protein